MPPHFSLGLEVLSLLWLNCNLLMMGCIWCTVTLCHLYGMLGKSFILNYINLHRSWIHSFKDKFPENRTRELIISSQEPDYMRLIKTLKLKEFYFKTVKESQIIFMALHSTNIFILSSRHMTRPSFKQLGSVALCWG